jgi:hypothetical protein
MHTCNVLCYALYYCNCYLVLLHVRCYHQASLGYALEGAANIIEKGPRVNLLLIITLPS